MTLVFKSQLCELEKDKNQTKPNHSPAPRHQMAIHMTGLLQSSCQSFILKNMIELMKTGLNWLQPVHQSCALYPWDNTHNPINFAS